MLRFFFWRVYIYLRSICFRKLYNLNNTQILNRNEIWVFKKHLENYF